MNVSASRMGLFDFCSYWGRPDVEAPRGETTRQQGRGTGFHSLLEAHFRALLLRMAGENPSAPEPKDFTGKMSRNDSALVAEVYAAFLKHPLSQVPWIPERAFAYDWTADTARLLPLKEGHRDYSDLREGEIPGTPDAHLFDPTTRIVHVPDWKFGEGNEARDLLSMAQGEFNSMQLARAFGATKAIASEVDFTPEGPIIKQRVFDSFDLDAIALTTNQRMAGIPLSVPKPGHHCSELWCPAVATCPETVRFAMGLIPGSYLQFNIQTPMQASTALHRLEVFEAACEVQRAQINRYADRLGGSFPLGDGRRFVRLETHPRKIDLMVDGAPAVLLEEGYRDAAEISTSRAALERVARSKGLVGNGVDSAVAHVYERMDAIGAVYEENRVEYKRKGRRHRAGDRTLPEREVIKLIEESHPEEPRNAPAAVGAPGKAALVDF